MKRLTSRNPDNTISTDCRCGKELLNQLAACEDKLESIERAIDFLVKLREMAFMKHEETYYSGKYSAFQKSVEVLKRAWEGKSYGK